MRHKTRAVKLPPHPILEEVSVKWKCSCGLFNTTLGPTISASGAGCRCDKQDYCYCPGPESYIGVQCLGCKLTHAFVF